jgi:hypothetical protein
VLWRRIAPYWRRLGVHGVARLPGEGRHSGCRSRPRPEKCLPKSAWTVAFGQVRFVGRLAEQVLVVETFGGPLTDVRRRGTAQAGENLVRDHSRNPIFQEIRFSNLGGFSRSSNLIEFSFRSDTFFQVATFSSHEIFQVCKSLVYYVCQVALESTSSQWFQFLSCIDF